MINGSERIIVTVFDKAVEYVDTKPIKEVGSGVCETSFTVNGYGFYSIHTAVDGHHIPGSPYK